MGDEIFDLNTTTARGIVVIYAKYNDRFIPVKVLPDGSLASQVSLNVGDLEIGSVEIKDSETDNRVNVGLDVNKNALYVKSESLSQENTQQLIGADIREIKTDLNQIKTKILDGTTFKEFLWNPEILSITSTTDTLFKVVNCRLVKTKTFYILNNSRENVWVTLNISVDDINDVTVLSNQKLTPSAYLLFDESRAFMSFKVIARSATGNGSLVFSGYGLGG